MRGMLGVIREMACSAYAVPNLLMLTQVLIVLSYDALHPKIADDKHLFVPFIY